MINIRHLKGGRRVIRVEISGVTTLKMERVVISYLDSFDEILSVVVFDIL